MGLLQNKLKINRKRTLELSPSKKESPLCPLRLISPSIFYSFKVCSETVVPRWPRVASGSPFASKLLVLRRLM